MTTQDLRDMFQAFAHTLGEEDSAASNLWTWLPSKAILTQAHSRLPEDTDDGDEAQVERAVLLYGTPSLLDIVKEATAVLAVLAGHTYHRALFRSYLVCDCEICQTVFDETIQVYFKDRFDFTLDVEEPRG